MYRQPLEDSDLGGTEAHHHATTGVWDRQKYAQINHLAVAGRGRRVGLIPQEHRRRPGGHRNGECATSWWCGGFHLSSRLKINNGGDDTGLKARQPGIYRPSSSTLDVVQGNRVAFLLRHVSHTAFFYNRVVVPTHAYEKSVRVLARVFPIVCRKAHAATVCACVSRRQVG